MEVPTELLDRALVELSPNAFKLFMFVWRKTAGWQKEKDSISYSQIIEATGIGSRVTVKKTIDELGGFITIEPGRGRSNMYEFDVSEFYRVFCLSEKGTENEPFTHSDSLQYDVKGIENEPFDEVKGTETEPIKQEKVQKVDVLPVKGTESVHTIKDSKDSISLSKDDKDIDDVDPLIPTTKKELLLFELINEQRKSQRRRNIKKFKHQASREKYQRTSAYFNGRTEQVIRKTIESIDNISVTAVVNYMAGWARREKADSATSERSSPKDSKFRTEGFNPYTGKTERIPLS